MKVYIVVMWLPYEGSYVEKVFDTREKAQAFADSKNQTDPYGDYVVDEQEVN